MSDKRTDPRTTDAPRGGSVVVLGIIGLALLLAIGYFLLVNDRREGSKTEAVIGTAQSVDKAANSIVDAAKTPETN